MMMDGGTATMMDGCAAMLMLDGWVCSHEGDDDKLEPALGLFTAQRTCEENNRERHGTSAVGASRSTTTHQMGRRSYFDRAL